MDMKYVLSTVLYSQIQAEIDFGSIMESEPRVRTRMQSRQAEDIR